LNWRALSGRPFADGKPWVIPVSRQQREREDSDVNVMIAVSPRILLEKRIDALCLAVRLRMENRGLFQ
jgi:hypothetical protein